MRVNNSVERLGLILTTLGILVNGLVHVLTFAETDQLGYTELVIGLDLILSGMVGLVLSIAVFIEIRSQRKLQKLEVVGGSHLSSKSNLEARTVVLFVVFALLLLYAIASCFHYFTVVLTNFGFSSDLYRVRDLTAIFLAYHSILAWRFANKTKLTTVFSE